MKKQQAILFDLDGTLLNTLDALTSGLSGGISGIL